ncbi:hypothetical protein [Hymenobacter wooponensis]|uniref:Uncharacterized protein n=1 Tax=Hymenobacter wooponensis TaxID=1525360 RepID=A0A4Z0MMJ8_9BACT|nr:hypothetical protein [Hymenobacter wooponensis]TGD80405.1 hypothetical protein EU557_11225 [Hymenobacter wooponensis]
MLLPLIGLIFGVVGSATLGAIVIAIHPIWKLAFKNIALFVVGAFAGAIGSSILYTWIFADENQQLNSSEAVVGYLVMLCAGTVTGGTLSTFIGTRLFSKLE